MPSSPSTPVEIHACTRDVPSIPPWFAELVLLARHFAQRGVLAALSQQVTLARGRAGRYDVIDFVVVLLGYALSGEPTLEAFFARVAPFAHPFMALFGRVRLPHRATLSRFLADVDGPCLETLRQQFAHDLRHYGPSGMHLGGLTDRCGHCLLIFDVDGTRQAARQRALLSAPEYPPPGRRMDHVCAPGYLGRKRGEVVRTRTTVLQAHTQQWLGTFAGAGNGDYAAELEAACCAVVGYLQAKGLRLTQALLRLDALYGTASILACVQHAGLGFVTRGRDYQLLEHPLVQARLRHPADLCVQHPETGVQRDLFDVGYIADWLEPTPEHSLTCRVIVARQIAPARAEEVASGKLVGASVYELFVTTVPAACLRADEVVALYYQRGAFERVLSEEDVEQDPDRWCSHLPAGQEFWQIVSQWVWNTRLELGLAQQEVDLRRTQWSDAILAPSASPAGGVSDVRGLAEQPETALGMTYGPPEVARDWGRASGRLAGHAFEMVDNGTLRCPAGKILRPQERRKEADGSLRVVYRARTEDCRTCPLVRDCLGPHASGDQPRRVSTVRRRVVQTASGRGGPARMHESTPADGSPGEHAVVWCDLPAARIRRTYSAPLRQQQVMIVVLPGVRGARRDVAAPPLWTRAERAHRRLSWAARLLRNACDAGLARYAYTVCGVRPPLAAFLSLSPASS